MVTTKVRHAKKELFAVIQVRSSSSEKSTDVTVKQIVEEVCVSPNMPERWKNIKGVWRMSGNGHAR